MTTERNANWNETSTQVRQTLEEKSAVLDALRTHEPKAGVRELGMSVQFGGKTLTSRRLRVLIDELQAECLVEVVAGHRVPNARRIAALRKTGEVRTSKGALKITPCVHPHRAGEDEFDFSFMGYAKAFNCEDARWYSFRVDEDDDVTVFDGKAGYFTSCHSLDADDLYLLRAEAARKRLTFLLPTIDAPVYLS